jgi:hypothetical protein
MPAKDVQAWFDAFRLEFYRRLFVDGEVTLRRGMFVDPEKERKPMIPFLNEPKDYTGGTIVLPDTAREIECGERVACNCCGAAGTVIEREVGNRVLRYWIEWDSGPVAWGATNSITPLSDHPRPVCVCCRTSHPPERNS